MSDLNNLKSLLLSCISEKLPSSIICILRHKNEYHQTWRLQVPLPDDIQASIPQRQNEYILGRICAAEALFQLGSKQLNVGRNIQYAPIWPDRTVGSISHNNEWVIACVAWQSEYIGLGIDIETCINFEHLDSMYKYVYIKDEIVLLQQEGFDELTASTILFSIKESIIKLFLSQKIFINQFQNIQLIGVNGSQLILQIASPFIKRLIGQFWIHHKIIITLITEKRG